MNEEPLPLPPPLANDKPRLRGLLEAIAARYRADFRSGQTPSRYVDETYKAFIAVAELSDAERGAPLRFRYHVMIAVGRLSGQTPFTIEVTHVGVGRFHCRILQPLAKLTYAGPRPDANEGILDEGAFLALAERCFAFHAVLLARQPIDPRLFHERCRRHFDAHGLELSPGPTVDGRGLRSAFRSLGGGWRAHFQLSEDDTLPGAVGFVITRPGQLGELGDPGFMVHVRARRDEHGRDRTTFFLRQEHGCADYDGDRPDIPSDCRELGHVDDLLRVLLHFHDGLPLADDAARAK